MHQRLRDTLRFLRLAMAEGRVNEQFQTIPGTGFVMGSRPDPPPPILVAACGPRALELAAREADGVVLNWITPGDVERVSPLPRHRRDVSVVVPACPTADREVMDRTMRPVVSNYLHVPAYAAQQRRLGRAGALEQMWSAWDRGDRSAARAALPAAVLDEFIVGDPGAIRERLDEIERRTGVGVIATFYPPEGMSFGEATGQTSAPHDQRAVTATPKRGGAGCAR